jgi:MFS family permease
VRPEGPEPDRRWALRSRDYRLFMLGNLISWVGDWMDLAALNWLVLERTGSALHLGLVNACRLVPVFALSLPAGVLADRVDRRRLLLGLQAGTMALTLAVGALVAWRSAFIPLAVVVAVRAGLTAMALPIRNALLPSLVPREALAGAVAGQAAGLNLSRILGPAAAGALMHALPVEAIFWINGASFAAVLWTLVAVRAGAKPTTTAAGAPKPGLREAVAYVRADEVVGSLLVLAVVPMIFGFPYTSLMPAFSRAFLGVGPAGFGALLSISAVGALAGSTWLSVAGSGRRAGRDLVASTVGFGLSLLALTASRSFAAAAAAMFAAGLASQLYRTTSRIALQHHVPEALRGRILSIALMDRGLIPLGAVLMGAVAEFAGAARAGLLMGAGCIVVTLVVLAARPRIWRL